MGLTQSAEEPPLQARDVDEESVAASVIQKSWKKQQTDFKWPQNLSVEAEDMTDCNNLTTHLSTIFAASAKSTLKGMEEAEDASGGKSKLTLAQLQSIVENNKDELVDSKEDILATLSSMGERTSSRKVAVVALDMPKIAEKVPFFYVLKDDKLKRITLAFPSSHADYRDDWTTKGNFKMIKAPLKRALKAKISGDRIAEVSVHVGMYNFLFASTKAKEEKNEQAPAGGRKYDDIKEALKAIFENFPKHRLYVTGHGTGAGLAHVAAFFLTFDSDIAKPISCVNFGAPRVGDQSFWRACQLLEIAGKLRTCRFQIDDDAFCSHPSAKEYVHASYAIKLIDGKDPEAAYPKIKNDHVPRPKMLKMFDKKKTSYKTIADYAKALEGSKEKLGTMDLNALYHELGASNFSVGPAAPAKSSSRSESVESQSLKASNKSDNELKEEPEKEEETAEETAEKTTEEETPAETTEEQAAEAPKAEE